MEGLKTFLKRKGLDSTASETERDQDRRKRLEKKSTRFYEVIRSKNGGGPDEWGGYRRRKKKLDPTVYRCPAVREKKKERGRRIKSRQITRPECRVKTIRGKTKKTQRRQNGRDRKRGSKTLRKSFGRVRVRGKTRRKRKEKN